MGLDIQTSMGYGTSDPGENFLHHIDQLYKEAKRVSRKEYLNTLAQNNDEFISFVSTEGFRPRHLEFFYYEIKHYGPDSNVSDTILYSIDEDFRFVNFVPISKVDSFVRKNDAIDYYDREQGIRYLNNSGIHPYFSSHLKIMRSAFTQYFKIIPSINKLENCFIQDGEDIIISNDDFELLKDEKLYFYKSIYENNQNGADVDSALQFVFNSFRPSVPVEILSVFFLFIKKFEMKKDVALSYIDRLRPCIITNFPY